MVRRSWSTCAVVGRTADARRLLKRVTEISRQRYVPAWDFTLIHEGTGERDESFRWLQKVEEDHRKCSF
jgi:hypothetical protein